MKNENSLQKYFNALKDLHDLLSYTDNISLSAFVKKKGISKAFILVLRQAKILKTNGKLARGCRYYWDSIPPNMAMAERVLQEVSDYHSKYNTKKTKTVSPKELKTVKDKSLNYTITRLFFGLIKIKTLYYYK